MEFKVISTRPLRNIETIEKKGTTSEPNYDRFSNSISFSEKFNNVKDRVESILKRDKFARVNDLWLLLLYYNEMGYITLKIDINKFKGITMPETISRSRRKLFEEIKTNKRPELSYLLDNQEFRVDQENRFKDMFDNKNNSKLAEVIK